MPGASEDQHSAFTSKLCMTNPQCQHCLQTVPNLKTNKTTNQRKGTSVWVQRFSVVILWREVDEDTKWNPQFAGAFGCSWASLVHRSYACWPGTGRAGLLVAGGPLIQVPRGHVRTSLCCIAATSRDKLEALPFLTQWISSHGVLLVWRRQSSRGTKDRRW